MAFGESARRYNCGAFTLQNIWQLAPAICGILVPLAFLGPCKGRGTGPYAD